VKRERSKSWSVKNCVPGTNVTGRRKRRCVSSRSSEYQGQGGCQYDAEAHHYKAQRIEGRKSEHRKQSTRCFFQLSAKFHTRFEAR
jgi:hypothetical protein